MFAAISENTIDIKLVVIAGDGCARVLVGARVASTVVHRRTTDLAAGSGIAILVKRVGIAGDRLASVTIASAARCVPHDRANTLALTATIISVARRS